MLKKNYNRTDDFIINYFRNIRGVKKANPDTHKVSKLALFYNC